MSHAHVSLGNHGDVPVVFACMSAASFATEHRRHHFLFCCGHNTAFELLSSSTSPLVWTDYQCYVSFALALTRHLSSSPWKEDEHVAVEYQLFPSVHLCHSENLILFWTQSILSLFPSLRHWKDDKFNFIQSLPKP